MSTPLVAMGPLLTLDPANEHAYWNHRGMSLLFIVSHHPSPSAALSGQQTAEGVAHGTPTPTTATTASTAIQLVSLSHRTVSRCCWTLG